MECIKKVLKKIGIFDFLKRIVVRSRTKKKLNGKFIFEDRKKDFSKVCIVLAGYKPFLYNAIFGRIKKFIPEDIEVCIVSSGKYDNELSIIAEENNWSYLSIKKNCVTLAQNIAINLFKNAEYIYKLDEDIFVTDNYLLWRF